MARPQDQTAASAARRLANRRNARASTGPRTARGKARVAQNARKHGLGVPLSRDPAWQVRFIGQARQLVGDQASEQALELATDFVAANHELARVRWAMLQVVDAYFQLHAQEAPTSAAAGPPAENPRQVQIDRLVVCGIIGRPGRKDGLSADEAAGLADLSQEQFRLWVADRCLEKLVRLQEYARKARSRRHNALQDLCAALRQPDAMAA